jgi:hypothetical protein
VVDPDRIDGWQITSPHFCAGIVFNQHGYIVSCAPIVSWMRTQRWNKAQVLAYCRKRHWRAVSLR